MHKDAGARYFDLNEIMPEGCLENVSTVTGGTYDSLTGRITLDAGSSAAQYAYSANENHTLNVNLKRIAIPVMNIDEEHFPDENFRSWCKEQRWGSDGVLSDVEIESINYIGVGWADISDLTGIEYFVNINDLSCDGNNLTSLDLSALPLLEYLSCNENKLTALDISGNILLTDINCGNNMLTSVNVDGLSELKYLNCYNNQLNAVNLATNTALIHLNCDNNVIRNLDVTKNTALNNLLCECNLLTTLDVSKNPELHILSCKDNSITKLDLTGNKYLEDVDVRGNFLSTISIPKDFAEYPPVINPQSVVIMEVKEEGSNLYFDLHDIMPDTCFGKVTMISGGTLDTATGRVAIADRGAYATYEYDAGYGYKMTVKLHKPGEKIADINATNFPSAGFRDWCLSQKWAKDGVLTDVEAEAVTEIDVSGYEIYTLEGIQLFPRVQYLFADYSYLTELDVSMLEDLVQLSCKVNNITELDLSKNVNLCTLNCKYNKLTELDLSKNEKLDYLSCGYNSLAKLTLREHAILDTLSIAPQNGKEVQILEDGEKRYIDLGKVMPEECFENVMSLHGGVLDTATGHVTLNDGADVITYKYRVNAKYSMPVTLYSFGDVEIPIDEAHFPDSKFREWCRSEEWGEDGILSASEIVEITDIGVEDREIQSLIGIENFKLLQTLYCGHNELTELDVSALNLTELYCYDNQLTELKLPSFGLTKLECNNNKLTELNVPFDNLKSLDCGANNLTELDLSDCEALKTLDCSSNNISELDLSNNGELRYLYCSDNNLVTLMLMEEAILDTFNVSSQNGKEVEIYEDGGARYIALGDIMSSECFVNITSVRGGAFDALTGRVTLNDGADTITYVYRVNAEYTMPVMLYSFGDIEIPIDEAHFPDVNFREWCLSNEWGDDNILSASEIAGITEIDVDECGIHSMEGIENFKLLRTLACGYNELTELDVSALNLVNLYCYGNKLTKLILPNCDTLVGLYCSTNNLGELDLSDYYALQGLNCSELGLKELDLSNNPKLTYVYCGDNQLTELDLTNLHDLYELNCSGNEIAELDVSGCAKLVDLNCYDNNLTKLDLSNCPKLSVLSCSDCQLERLDLSNNKKLWSIDCSNNKIAWLDISHTNCDEIYDHTQSSIPVNVDANKVVKLLDLMPATSLAKVSDVTGGTFNSATGDILLDEGARTVTYEYDIGNGFSMTVTLRCYLDTAIDLPDSVTSIEAEAFMNSAFTGIRLPDGCKTIGARAFKDCIALTEIHIPSSVDSIADDAFDGCPNLTIYCVSNSPAHEYAERLGIPFVLE